MCGVGAKRGFSSCGVAGVPQKDLKRVPGEGLQCLSPSIGTSGLESPDFITQGSNEGRAGVRVSLQLGVKAQSVATGADIWAVVWRVYTSFEKRCWAHGIRTLILSLLICTIMTHWGCGIRSKIDSVAPTFTECRFYWGQTFNKLTCESIPLTRDESCEENVWKGRRLLLGMHAQADT